jgi:hypothetical protein
MSSGDDRERRLADAPKFLERMQAYAKVEPDARVSAIHSELMFAIDRALEHQKDHRFKQAEIEVLKDITFQIVYALDGVNHPQKSFRATLWTEFKRSSAMDKVKAIAAVGTFIAALVIGTLSFNRDYVRPYFSAPSAQSIPAMPNRP